MSSIYSTMDEAESAARSVNATRLFVLAFLCGAGLIGLSEFLATSRGLQEFSTGYLALGIGCPLLIMFIYFIEARKIANRPGTVSIEQVADSLYFIGFLFTLCALLVSLITLGANDEINTTAIVSRFGLALITTIVGLFAKTALTQFHMDEDQAVVQARSTLVSAVDELTETMTLASRRINDFVEQSSEQFASGTNQCLEVLNTRATQCADDLEAHLAQSLQNQTDKSHQCIDELHDSTVQSIGRMHARINESTSKVAEEYKDMVSDTLARRQEMAELIIETGKVAKEAISGMANDVSTACDTLGQKTRETNGALESLANTLQAATRSQTDLIDGLRHMDEALHESADNRQALNKAVRQVAGLSDELATGIRTIVDATEAQRQDHDSREAALLSSMERLIEQWREHDVSDRDQARQQLQSCLGGLTDHLVDESGKSLIISRDLHMALQELLRACQTAIEQQRTRKRWRL